MKLLTPQPLVLAAIVALGLLIGALSVTHTRSSSAHCTTTEPCSSWAHRW